MWRPVCSVSAFRLYSDGLGSIKCVEATLDDYQQKKTSISLNVCPIFNYHKAKRIHSVPVTLLFTSQGRQNLPSLEKCKLILLFLLPLIYRNRITKIIPVTTSFVCCSPICQPLDPISYERAMSDKIVTVCVINLSGLLQEIQSLTSFPQ